MKFDDYDDGGGNSSLIFMAMGVSLFILIVLGVVIASNKKSSNSNNYQAYQDSLKVSPEVSTETVDSKLTADDLDIWNMYPTEEEKEEEELVITPTPMPTLSLSPEESQAELDEKMDDGKHTKIICSDGSTEWVAINDKWEKNSYDFTNLKASNGLLKYYKDGKCVSHVGMDVSRYQGNIDYISAKEAGIEFVMIRVGARGYKTGELTIDDYFAQNIQRATDAGMDVGVYFYSQALTTQEAVDEANLVIAQLSGYKIKYPVAIDMELVDNDVSRVETLSVDDRTKVTAAFLNTIAAAGYKPMIYGNKEWLLKCINLGTFTTSSIWIQDSSDIPDYPYQFSMWQYTTEGSVNGVNGSVNLDISFVDYTAQ